MRTLLVCWLLAGCGSAPPAVESEGPPVEVRAALEREPEGGGGVLVVRVEHDPDIDIDLPVPQASGLEFELLEAPDIEELGSANVITQRFRFSGSRGHYEIQPVTVSYPGPDGEPVTAQSDAIFLDLETDPVEVGEIEDIEDPAATGTSLPWILLGAGLVAGGVVIAFWPRRSRPTVTKRPPLPPHLEALQAWEAVRADPSRTDEDKARELSVIFRRYVEAVMRVEATALTTSEILAYLQELRQLPQGNVPRAKRLLRATDRIKFAEERPSDELLDDLDADLRAFVEATRPSTVAGST